MRLITAFPFKLFSINPIIIIDKLLQLDINLIQSQKQQTINMMLQKVWTTKSFTSELDRQDKLDEESLGC